MSGEQAGGDNVLGRVVGEARTRGDGVLRRLGDSILVKSMVVGLVALALLIPAGMVERLVEERQYRQFEAVSEISGKWGEAQAIVGPLVTVPYQVRSETSVTDNRGQTRVQTNVSTKYIHILPDNLDISGVVNPEIRYRGIYKAILYGAELRIKGDFGDFRDKVAAIGGDDVLWDKAELSIGISDLRGIRESVAVKINGDSLPIVVGSSPRGHGGSGLKVRLENPREAAATAFDIILSLNGSQNISFAPLGKSTSVELRSPWNSPSFDGAFLPKEREISEAGFTARWQVFEFNRGYPQVINDAVCDFAASAFGVRLFDGNNIYQQSTRTVKYAVLFIVFTFATIFLGEIATRQRAHPFQYMMTGLAVTIFYVLLISISEHLDFTPAYLIAAAAVVSLIFGYAKCIFSKLAMPLTIATIQILLYGYFFITLQSEDYALLLGSVGLFILLAVVMYVTRKINWHKATLDETN